jgi:GNAT superfamily N-acetyltransferase
MVEAPVPGRDSGDDVRIGTDPADLDIGWIHRALSERAYWALGRTRAQVVASIENSICFGAYSGRDQIGFARVVTDQVTFGWICDVFVDEAQRGRGVGRQLIAAIVADPRLCEVRRLVLATRDAGDLYRRTAGFESLSNPDRWLQRSAAPPPMARPPRRTAKPDAP